MIYLKSFNLLKDAWVDYYFVPIGKRSEWMRPEDLPEEIDMREPDLRTIHNSWYPWKTFYNREFTNIEFSDITILYGNNASGKTTVLNVIAEKLQLQRTSLYNKSSFLAYQCYLNTVQQEYDKDGFKKMLGTIYSDDLWETLALDGTSCVIAAQYLLGRLYIDASHVTHDINAGIEWLTKASENGNWNATYTLGYFYTTGSYGIKRDTEKAKRLLEPLKKNVEKSQQEKLHFALSLCE